MDFDTTDIESCAIHVRRILPAFDLCCITPESKSLMNIKGSNRWVIAIFLLIIAGCFIMNPVAGFFILGIVAGYYLLKALLSLAPKDYAECEQLDTEDEINLIYEDDR